MSKTLKKGKRGSAAETRKSFLVTETGLVETEDEPENPRRESMSQRGSTSQKMSKIHLCLNSEKFDEIFISEKSLSENRNVQNLSCSPIVIVRAC